MADRQHPLELILISCSGEAVDVDPGAMQRVFDIGDRARLPWRFHGALCAVLARL